MGASNEKDSEFDIRLGDVFIIGVLVAMPMHGEENATRRESNDAAKGSTTAQTDEPVAPSTSSEKSGFARIFDKNGNEVPLLDKNGNEVPIEETHQH